MKRHRLWGSTTAPGMAIMSGHVEAPEVTGLPAGNSRRITLSLLGGDLESPSGKHLILRRIFL
jgi:hypothetical protein